MKIQPIRKNVYVVLDPVQATKTASGIVLPDKNSQLVRVGTVYGVGEEVKYIKRDNKVLVGFHVGTVLDSPILFESGVGDCHRMLTESEILAVILE